LKRNKIEKNKHVINALHKYIIIIYILVQMSSTKKNNKKKDNVEGNDDYIAMYKSDVPNDIVDIYGDIDVTVKKIETKKKTELTATLEGYNIDHVIANTIRRAVLLYIPIYGFHRSNIIIENEKSVHMYNNDLIYNLLETLPIYDIPNYFDITDPEVFMPNEIMKILFNKFLPAKYIEENTEPKEEDTDKKLFNIELMMNIKNTTQDFKFVSTHDAVIKIDGKVSNSYQVREPISILVLKPGENISFTATANLGIASMHAIYEATTTAVSLENNHMSYTINYETLEQLDKNIIFIKACAILIKKLEALIKYIDKKYKDSTEHLESEIIEIELYGEDDTLGNLITNILQKCTLTKKAGYAVPHPLISSVIIRYKMEKNSKKDPIVLFIDVLIYLIKLFNKIMDSYTKQSK
jgi:DNA-directed RNA polymerase subunit L